MPTTVLHDIRLNEYDNFKNLELIQRIRNGQITIKPAVCIERAHYVTQYLRDMSTDDEPMEVRYANAVHHFLSHKKPLFFDDNLLAGTTTSKAFGAPVYPELTGMTIWPELDTIGTLREKNPMMRRTGCWISKKRKG
jgi:formate C-acetyltransferase